ncbi:MAG: glycosyltransferase family 2 protein, partial [Nannocystaceae bacterium]
AGHAYAEGAYMHGDSPTRHFVKENKRIVFWAAVLPSVAVGAALPTLGASLTLLAGYPINAARVYRSVRGRGRSRIDAASYSAAVSVARFAELQGMVKFHLGRLRGERSRLIEYK